MKCKVPVTAKCLAPHSSEPSSCKLANKCLYHNKFDAYRAAIKPPKQPERR